MFAPDQVGFDTQVGVAGACAYTLIMALWRALPRGAGRDWSFTLLNLGFVYLGFFAPDWTRPLKYSVESLVTILVYLAAVTVHYRLLAEARKGRQQLWLLAIWLPIATLFAVKVQTAWQAMGLSYLSFRMALASMEIRDGRASLGSLAQYLGFLFFLPTFSLGPISPLSMYDTGMACGSVSRAGLLLGAGRILTGYLMFKVLAPFFQQLSFTNLLNDGFVHGALDFLLSAYCSLAYLYFNFSGACHMAIGLAALIGIPVLENFNEPIFSRNLKDFWNRWHISLSQLVRDLVFTPLNLALMRRLPPRAALVAPMVAAMATFVLIGLWHGPNGYMLVMGLVYGLGFCVNLGFDEVVRRFRWQKKSLFKWRTWHVFAVFLTLTFVALTNVCFDLANLDAWQAWSGTAR